MGKGWTTSLFLKKGSGDRTAAAAKMTQELDDFYEGGTSHANDCTLDRFMVDYDIKAFAEESLGMNSWDDSKENWDKIFSKTVRVVPYLNGTTSCSSIINVGVSWLRVSRGLC